MTEAAKQLAAADFPAFRDADEAWWQKHIAPEFIRHTPIWNSRCADRRAYASSAR